VVVGEHRAEAFGDAAQFEPQQRHLPPHPLASAPARWHVVTACQSDWYGVTTCGRPIGTCSPRANRAAGVGFHDEPRYLGWTLDLMVILPPMMSRLT
jgi:hypothetical protein